MNKARYPQHKGNGLNAYVHIICRCIHPYLYLKILPQTSENQYYNNYKWMHPHHIVLVFCKRKVNF